jgi:hypothetical protein
VIDTSEIRLGLTENSSIDDRMVLPLVDPVLVADLADVGDDSEHLVGRVLVE